MTEYIETKVRYQKVLESGQAKTVTESYLVDALSFAEAERKTVEHLTPCMQGDFAVSAVRKSRVREVVESTAAEDTRFYKAKLRLVALDERTGAEKRTPLLMLAQADTLENAVRTVHEAMRGTVSDWELEAVSLTGIVELIK